MPEAGGERQRADDGAHAGHAHEDALAALADVEDVPGYHGHELHERHAADHTDEGENEDVEHRLLAADVGEAVDDIPPGAAAGAELLGCARQVHDADRPEGVETAHDVVDGREAEGRHHEPGGGGGQDAEGVHAHHVEGNGVHEVLGFHDLRDDGLPGRHHQAHDTALEDRGGDEDPPGAGDGIAEVADREGNADGGGDDGRGQHGHDEDVLLVEPVRDGAAPQREEDHGNGVGEGGQPEHDAGIADLVDDPGAGQHAHVHGAPLADHADEVQPEVAVAQRGEGMDVVQPHQARPP